MKLVYVAGRFRSNTPWETEQNIRRAEEAGFNVATRGGVPIIPHTMYRYFDGQLKDEFWLDGTLEILKRCDGILLIEGWTLSRGAQVEQKVAVELGKPVYYAPAAFMDPLTSPEASAFRLWLTS